MRSIFPTKLFLLLVLLASGAEGPLYGEPIRLSAQVAVDPGDDDCDFRKLPGAGDGEYLCLWERGVLVAVVTTNFYEYTGDVPGLLALVKDRLTEKGCEDFKFTSLESVPTASGSEIPCFQISYGLKGRTWRTILYVIRSRSGFHTLGVVNREQSAFEGTRLRMNAIVSTATTSDPETVRK